MSLPIIKKRPKACQPLLWKQSAETLVKSAWLKKTINQLHN